MAISQAMCSSFKQELLVGTHNFTASSGNTFKLALYTSSADLSASTTAYSTTNEISGTGYTAGGNTLTIASNSTTSGTTAFVDFSDTSWTSSSITARGALIYKSGGTNPSVAVLDFGENKSSVSGTFTITFPAADASNAIIRIV